MTIVNDSQLEPEMPPYMMTAVLIVSDVENFRNESLRNGDRENKHERNEWNEISLRSGYVLQPSNVVIDLPFRLPKNLKWTDYPILGNPHYRMDYPKGDKRDSQSLYVELVESTVWIWTGSADVLLDMIHMRRLMGLEHKVKIMTTHDDIGLQDVDLAPYLERERLEKPWKRFLWSYAANWDALGEKALRLVNNHPNCDFKSDLSHRGMQNPWCIQLLFACRRSDQERWEGQKLSCYLSEKRRNHLERPGLLYDTSCNSYRADWPGTGRYTPLPKDKVFFYDDIDSCYFRLQNLGLIEEEFLPGYTKRFVKLLPRGEALLDLLPPDMEDPDLFLRWRRGENGLPLASDEPAMDRWINSKFRKFKQRLDKVDLK
jgi:hypothetical protein